MGCRRPSKILRISKKYRIFFIIKLLRLLYLLLLKNSSYLINDRWGLRGHSGWFRYTEWIHPTRWGLRGQSRRWAYWLDCWANPSRCPSFVIFFVIYSPASPCNILNSHKTFVQRQIVSQGILKFKKREVKNDDLKMNSRLPCCMRVENVELAVWAREWQERDSKNHKILLLTKNWRILTWSIIEGVWGVKVGDWPFDWLEFIEVFEPTPLGGLLL